MNAIDILEKKLHKSRTSSELTQWVTSINEEIKSSTECRKSARVTKGKKGLIKKFREEALPLEFYARLKDKGREYSYKLSPCNESYDATAKNTKGDIISYVQITQAIDGHQNHLRMEHLNDYYRAPLTGQGIDFKSGKEVMADFERRDDRILGEFKLIQSAIERKSSHCGNNTDLVIEFDSLYSDDEYMKDLKLYLTRK